MQSFTFSFLFVFGLICLVNCGSLPEKFLGTWELGQSENFDEYLEAKGHGWIMRQLIKTASITRIITHKAGSVYNYKVLTARNNVDWDFELDKEFQGMYLDDLQRKVIFSYNPSEDKLVEKHTKVDSDEKPDVFVYKFDSEGTLIQHLEHNGVKAKRYYKKSKPT